MQPRTAGLRTRLTGCIPTMPRRLLLSAIESVGEVKDGKLYVDRAALRQEIAATDGFQGLLGTLFCDDFGDCGTGRINIYHHTDPDITDPAQLPVVYRFPL